MAEEEEKEGEETAPTKSKKKKLIIIGAAALVLALAGGGAAMVLLGGDDPPEDPIEEPLTPGQEIVEDAGGEGGGHGAPEPEGGGNGEAGAEEEVELDDHGIPIPKASGHADAGPKKETTLYKFAQPFVVNIADPSGRRYLNTIIHVKTVDASVVAEMESNVAPLRDTLIMLLSSKSMEELARIEGKIKLKQEIILRMESILGHGTIREVYFTEFNMLVI